MSYIGAEVIISPLGNTAEENWNALVQNRSGISFVDGAGFGGGGMYLAKMPALSAENRFENLLADALSATACRIDPNIISSPDTIVIISSTKGALDHNIKDQFGGPVESLIQRFKLANQPVVVSNACISGVLAINAAGKLINAGIYEHAIVIGCDVVSDFVVNGFQSLFAVSDKPCAPFDADRNGITLGEGCAATVVSVSRDIFQQNPFRLLEGASANDANHISGPSRTGEGLVRSVKKTLSANGVDPSEIDFVCAHGTATVYNDEMESIAFDRLGIGNIPLSSLKGYFGHTLGAAGLIETATSMQMMRNSELVKSLGYRSKGTTKPLNIITKNEKKRLSTVLKTASGFGGGNAALLIRSI
ncbi:beta-ketoacyl-[acyl-carrier-protein] synthase family protein [Dyadobacter aurulentus]|uniref:beta-ketoacyl-[acyl-carrier-protein] synthase family protein n=1 Tax=Dyadobacter sp. UC 10 TaxID=2605428 RepID=UPI0011F14A04|nr:beta-ketoacyl synthase N-terminal-like domain-containing protein [Dyadobacter sp. UC 10]KAA0992560.1 beta-ketoacyl synthase [Dyadobacter sp. UC 10]